MLVVFSYLVAVITKMNGHTNGINAVQSQATCSRNPHRRTFDNDDEFQEADGTPVGADDNSVRL